MLPTRRHLPALALLGLLVLASGCIVNVKTQGTEAASPVGASLRENQEVQQTLAALNAATTQRDVAATMALFDDTDDIRKILAAHLKEIYALPFVLSFDLPSVTVHVEGQTAWIFSEGTEVINEGEGKISRTPYRLTVCLVKRGEHWKWQVFSGSVPRPPAS
ncbi:MAG: nuclear transport factor 2 family protein [Opitutales bacterium]|nr:nuclear transport factor 2 family protein [Opitutales bacterium]